MPKFKCSNESCSNFDKLEHYTNIKYKWNGKTMRLEADESFCPICGTFRESIKEYDGWSDSWFKAESNRNYDNKVVKKYDYDHSVHDNKVEKLKI